VTIETTELSAPQTHAEARDTLQGPRLDIGCGPLPTPGWTNYDNSLAVRIGRWSFVADALFRIGIIRQRQYDNVKVSKETNVRWADATRRIPEPDSSAQVVYSSCMLEHLAVSEACRFLREVHRVLMPGGYLRLIVPDLRKFSEDYVRTGDSETFLQNMEFYYGDTKGLTGRIQSWLVGFRGHKWMYDGPSLCRLLESEGFVDVDVAPSGTTRIPDASGLDLSTRQDRVVAVEARRPR